MPLRYSIPNEYFQLEVVARNCEDAFDISGQENQGWYVFERGARLWLAHRSSTTMAPELVFYIVGSDKGDRKELPDIVIPLSLVQKLEKERARSTGATTGECVRCGIFKILAEIDTQRGPEWFTLKMELEEYKKCKKALGKDVAF